MSSKRSLIILNVLKLFTVLSYIHILTTLDYVGVNMWAFLAFQFVSGLLGIFIALLSLMAIVILLTATILTYSKTTLYLSILSIPVLYINIAISLSTINNYWS